MAIPSDGELSMLKIAKEIKIDNYHDTIPSGTFLPLNSLSYVSLGDMSTASNGFSGDTINTSNPVANRPDGSTPHSMSEFYSYDHDYLSPYIYLAWSRTVGNTAASNTLWTDPNNSYNTDTIVNPTGTGTVSRWRQSSFSVQEYQGRRIKLIIGFNHGTGSFRCDTCLSSWYLTNINSEYFVGEEEYNPIGSIKYGRMRFRYVNPEDDWYIDISNGYPIVMQRHDSHTQGNPIYLSLSSYTSFPTSFGGYDEISSTTDGEWNYYDSSNSNFPQTASTGTGPEDFYLARDLYSDGFMDSEQPEITTGGAYVYYEASNQSGQRYAWYRTVTIDLPEDADTLYFNYCAYSTDQTNWYNSWLKIYVHLH
jgi:hypothetical protein